MNEDNAVNESGNVKTILLIDDQRIFISALTSVLESWGYKVYGFTDPAAAFSAFKKQDYTIVLCDLYMASVNGFMLLSRFCKEKPEQICCLITGAENDEVLLRKTISLRNVKGLVKKPISYDKLQQVLEQAAAKTA
ncbi:response regulator [Thalassotalea ganghwensis]